MSLLDAAKAKAYVLCNRCRAKSLACLISIILRIHAILFERHVMGYALGAAGCGASAAWRHESDRKYFPALFDELATSARSPFKQGISGTLPLH